VTEVQAEDFPRFFHELHGKGPFPWQEELAYRVCNEGWPETIDVPTASGKTGCLDIAVFDIAVRSAAAPRRIFFVVDRRVIVNEAHIRMGMVAAKLKAARNGVLGCVAKMLLNAAGPGAEHPLAVYEMRGGIFRDETWVRNPLQPTVVASTVDQVGSRLLFRGYGISQNSWPVHAGLIGNDAIVILDEAHCSRAFSQTLQRVEEYRGPGWAVKSLGAPFRFVEMTATPARNSSEPVTITDRDRNNEVLGRRLRARKPTRLLEVKAARGDFGRLAEELASEALRLAVATRGKRIAVFANRVRTAKLVWQRLRERAADAVVELVIGRMRPVDRDDLYERSLASLKSGNPRMDTDRVVFVVSTQCLEVGADLDFDAIATECASIDALLQRFGRLDRLGDFQRAQGSIVISSWQISPKQPDPIYGEALSKTWEWLVRLGGDARDVNLAVESIENEPQTVAEALKSAGANELRMVGPDAPVLLPSHLDAFVQTNPVPQPDPSVELFLHGPKHGAPDVNVMWRRDLNSAPEAEWSDIVRLCPPASPEAMPVQFHVFKKWFAGAARADEFESDLETSAAADDAKQDRAITALVSQGDNSYLACRADQFRPGQTIVLPEAAGGWNELGHIPEDRPIDVADDAAFRVRTSISLRLHPDVIAEWPKTSARDKLLGVVQQEGADLEQITAVLQAYAAELDQPTSFWPAKFVSDFLGGKLSRTALETYPGRRMAHVLLARRHSTPRQTGDYILLEDHLNDVVEEVGKTTGIDGAFKSALEQAARFHDYGKVDLRYQAWLRGGDLLAARYAPKPVAKSGRDPVGKQASVGLPEGFRHELLSLLFAETAAIADRQQRDLVLHIVASHHGRCRPFAPAILDANADCVTYGNISLCASERAELAPHRLDRGVADRFWRLTRQFGWWGLAYIEALFRLADWRASERESAEVSE
jgi:CRISPR-associated endonuclease/helicase Cas3